MIKNEDYKFIYTITVRNLSTTLLLSNRLDYSVFYCNIC